MLVFFGLNRDFWILEVLVIGELIGVIDFLVGCDGCVVSFWFLVFVYVIVWLSIVIYVVILLFLFNLLGEVDF